MLDNYPMDEEIYDRRFFMKENLLLAVPASFESNKAAQAWGMTSDDIKQNVHMRPEVYGVALKLFEQDPFLMLRPTMIQENGWRQSVNGPDLCRVWRLRWIRFCLFWHIQNGRWGSRL